MTERNTRCNTRLFIAFLLLAGAANALSFNGIMPLEALMTGINYLIYTGLLLFWLAVRMLVKMVPGFIRKVFLKHDTEEET